MDSSSSTEFVDLLDSETLRERVLSVNYSFERVFSVYWRGLNKFGTELWDEQELQKQDSNNRDLHVDGLRNYGADDLGRGSYCIDEVFECSG